MLEKHRCCDLLPLKPAAWLLFRQPPDAAVPERHLEAAKLPRTHGDDHLDEQSPTTFISSHPGPLLIQTLHPLGQGPKENG